MLGFFGTLGVGTRALQTQRQGIEVAGHNIANVNNPAYSRQRLQIESSSSLDNQLGPQGTGADGVAIVQLRSLLLDQQIQGESSVSGYLEALQTALESAEANLGQTIDTKTGSADSTEASGSSSGQHSLAEGLSDFFNSFQSLSSDPSAPTARQVVLMKAADLTSRLNQTDGRLAALQSQLNDALDSDSAKANDLLSQIAELNKQILSSETASSANANDLRDLRQSKVEQLAGLANIGVSSDAHGLLDISIGGTTLVSGASLLDTLQTYNAGGGQWLVQAKAQGTALNLTGGTLGGTIAARDGEVATLRSNLDTLASTLISQVNQLHSSGYNLAGGSGANFFSGTGSADIQVNSELLTNPSLLQASGVAGAAGDNQVALAVAHLADTPLNELNNQTLAQFYGQSVATLGQSLSSASTQVDDQKSVQTMLSNQRDSISSVSLDEEMSDMMKYQKAFEASARLISVVNDMLETLIRM